MRKAATYFQWPAARVASIQQDASLPHASSALLSGRHRQRRPQPHVRSMAGRQGGHSGSGGFGETVTYTGPATCCAVLERQGVSMQVYLKINGVWQSAPQNLTNVPWLTACHDDPEGKVEEVVFMYANAEISPSAPNYTRLLARGALNPGLLATNIGCRDWTGSISMTKPLPAGRKRLRREQYRTEERPCRRLRRWASRAANRPLTRCPSVPQHDFTGLRAMCTPSPRAIWCGPYNDRSNNCTIRARSHSRSPTPHRRTP